MILRTALLLILSSLVCITATAEETKRIRLWDETPPGPASKPSGDEHDMTKQTDNLVGGSRIIKLGNVSTPELHIFLPPKENANRGVALVCPGGGFSILAWDLEGTEVAQWLNSLGFAAAVLKYRVPTRGYEGAEVWQGPVMDAQRGLSVIGDHAQQWNVDSDRVGILGFSTGGQVAARASLAKGQRLSSPSDKIDQSSCDVNFAILVYPAWIASDSGELNEGFEVDGQSPPMFFVHAVNDRVSCMSSVALFAALKKADVPAELHIFAAGGHGYEMRETELPVTRWPSFAAKWLDNQILTKSTKDSK